MFGSDTAELERRIGRLEEHLGIDDEEDEPEKGVYLRLIDGVGSSVLVESDGITEMESNSLPSTNPVEVHFEEDAVYSESEHTGWRRGLEEGERGWNTAEFEVVVYE